VIKLRVVGYSADLTNLILTSKKQGRKGSHVAPIDDRLFDVLEEVWRERKIAEREERRSSRASDVPEEPRLAPREVQRLLRIGQTPAQVAELAGASVSWVERFMGPVLQEREGIVRQVQNLWLEKPRLGVSGLPLGESVVANLRSRHVRMNEDDLADAWTATRQEGQPWVVALEFPFRGRRQRATWRYNPQSRSLVAVNRLAADLGWVKNGKKSSARVLASTPAKPSARKTAKRKPARKVAKRKPARKVARRPARKVAVRRPARKPAARKPARKVAKRKTARKPAARRPTRKVASRRQPAAPKRKPAKRKVAPRRKTTARRPVSRRAPARRKPARKAPAKRRTTARRTTSARRTARRR